MTDMQSPWLSRPSLAERLGVPESTVKYWAVKGTGPRFAKFGKHCRYHIDDVVAWEAEQFGEVAS